MSNFIKTVKGEEILVNDGGAGTIMIGKYPVRYSDLLPVVGHYVRGGLFGFRTEEPLKLPESELGAIRAFIEEMGMLKEVRVNFAGSTQIHFVPEKDVEAFKKVFDPQEMRKMMEPWNRASAEALKLIEKGMNDDTSDDGRGDPGRGAKAGERGRGRRKGHRVQKDAP